ncbi:MAG: 4-(cytidine 5'-diphospho)-2-C-methyl-D-erythritol kinase [Acidobacteriota bacterium]|nr:4-(cytidine 5'-diphospho)-2-C-methyl-D-erythritol kinase [Acidobacteriota bacterium]
MATCVRSHSKINLGLAIGPARPDGFHGLATLYQTLALHDWVTVEARPLGGSIASPIHGQGSSRITLTTNSQHVPTDARNTAWKMVELALARAGLVAEVKLHIEKQLPVQGGMGAGSANAAAALIGLERELSLSLPQPDRLAIAAEVGSDVPLFLIGGAILGTGRGEQVDGLYDFPPTPCVVAVPPIGVSTPRAFREWDAHHAATAKNGGAECEERGGLTPGAEPDRLEELSRIYTSVLGYSSRILDAAPDTSGIAGGSGSVELSRVGQEQAGFFEGATTAIREQSTSSVLAEDPLLALVRTGIENDFERVVFPQYPLLRDIKRELMGEYSDSPAIYAALSGSGSALFGLYRSREDAVAAQRRVQASGCKALLTETLPRSEYWRKMFAE